MDTFNPQDLASVMYSLHLVADHLHELLPEDVENSLATYDMFVSLAPHFRAQAAELLRETAAQVGDESRRQRVIQAADSIAKGEPGSQVAQSPPESVTLEEWQKQAGSSELEPAGPPVLPNFDLWDLFPGLVVRIGRTFNDFDGQMVHEGELLHFLKRDYFHYDGGFTLTFREKEIRLAEVAPENAPMIANQDNTYFVPVPTLDALLACWQLIHQQWNFLLKRSPEKMNVQHAAEIRAEIDACWRWLKTKGERGPAPVCMTAAKAVEAFPHDDRDTTNLALRITFLFAGVVAMV